MYKHIVKYLKIGTLSAVSLGLIGFISIKAAVPNEYVANYEIKESWEKALGIFVEIDAYNKINNPINQSKFAELNRYFATLFTKFPQDYSFKVVYEQCTQISSNLMKIPTTSDTQYTTQLDSFMRNCYKPFSDILKKINSQYTVTTKAKASPTSGPAPLTTTFDARGSIDPSGETIPSRNFYRYYRDTNGQDQVIGNGPVVSYTFEKEGNYLVHLTVKSSNKAKGILDGDTTLALDVSPKSAVLSVYANGQKMLKTNKVKVGTLEAEKGIVFDASSTIAMGGRQILSHHWAITTRDGFSYTKDGDGKPDLIRVALPGKGEYKVHLEVLDNENNKTSEDYSLVASDPVAIIKQSPEKGNTSSTFEFDGSPSYSVLSSLKLYTWEIFDQNGVKQETFQGKSIKQQFKTPGFYTVKLSVEDDLGQTNIDTLQVYVESTDPIPQFTIKPSSERLYPSKFILDATMSSDIDRTNGNDELSYERTFPEEAKANITDKEQENGKITVEFNAVGTFVVKLTVKDKYGKLSELEKEIEVKSILRPEIFVAPIATNRGSPLNFVVKTNEAILNYEWDFADGDKRSIQTDKISHLYSKTGVYKAKLKVSGQNETKNEISKTVFVGEKDYPIAAYETYDKNSIIMTQNETCLEKDPNGTGTISNPAYQIDRYQDITINPALSVNTKGESTDLQFYFQPRNKEIYKQSTFKYKFDELGCNYIDLTAEDTSIGKNNITRIWFKVVNALPKLDNIVLLFPQYGNEMGVGFNQNQVKDIFNSSFDPLIVKVTATNPVDPDGFISYYKWFYYLKDDPTRYIETKITPGDIPYAFFSLPKIPGEYSFGVMMYDNEDGKESSQNIIGNGPIVFFPPDSSRPDVPLVTLKMTQSTVEVGDEVTFDVISKIISDRPDFIKERTIYYDFDGDGTRDLVTKKDRVTYTYNKPSEVNGFRPRASVLYRGYRGVSNGGNIIVKNGLKPRLLVDTAGKLAIFRDISLGDISQKAICLDAKLCNDKNTITTGIAFSYTYPAPGKYFVSMDISDQYANESKKRLALTIDTGNNNDDFNFLSIPEATIGTGETGGIDLYVGNSLDNTILFYISHNENRGACYVDADIDDDSNGDGNSLNDSDFSCNEMYLKAYEAKYDSIIGRLYYTNKQGKMLSKDFTVGFIDFEANLDAETKKIYDELTVLLKDMNGSQWLTGSAKTFKDMVKGLKNNLADKPSTMANVVSLKDYMTKNTISLTKEQDTILRTVFLELSNRSTAAAEGLGEYGIAKADILSLLPTNLALEIDSLFATFESVVGDKTLDVSQQDKRKEVLQTIINTIQNHIAPDGKTPDNTQIEKADMDSIVLPNICKIMQIYNIPSATCNSSDETTKAVPDNLKVENGISTSTGTSWLKVVFIILGVFVAAFVGLVVVFAIRAKMRQEQEENTPTQPQQ